MAIHYYRDPKTAEERASCTNRHRIQYKEFVGCVLDYGEYNYHDDSDWYAVVWDETTHSVKRVEYMTTRFGGTDGNSAVIDATAEVIVKADAWCIEQATQIIRKNNLANSTRVECGRWVEVFKGRKVPIGTVGEVFGIYENSFAGRKQTAIRIVEKNGTSHFTDINNVKVRNPSQYMIGELDIAVMALGAKGLYRRLTDTRSDCVFI